MTGRLQSWMVPLLLLGTMAYALAEELTLTTYYPSPRGVYNELRTQGDVAIGKLDAPNARLEIRGRTLGTSENALAVGNLNGEARLVVQDDGNVGIGTTSPGQKLHVAGPVGWVGDLLEGHVPWARLPVSLLPFNCPAGETIKSISAPGPTCGPPVYAP